MNVRPKYKSTAEMANIKPRTMGLSAIRCASVLNSQRSSRTAKVQSATTPRYPQAKAPNCTALAAGAAEGIQGVGRDVIAPLDGNFLDRIGHILDSNAQKTFGYCLGRLQRRPCRLCDFLGQRLEFFSDNMGIHRLLATRSENGWEMVRMQLTQHYVAIRDGQRTTSAVAGRAGVGPSAIGANAISRTIKMQN